MDSDDMDKLVIEQGWLDSSERWDPVLRLCKDDELRESLERQFLEVPSAEARWTILKRRFDSKEREKAAKKGDVVPEEVEGEAKNFLLSFVLAYAYPKLDVNVSTGTNHLLKSPFCIHPKTGMIAVPLNPKTIHKVNLADIPRIE
ncbi:DNA primase small subunit [Aphelenchoides avenae]|nr:DNA primase small subunit [Aphelenchus avenae]